MRKENGMENSTADQLWEKIMEKFETLEDGQMLEIDLNIPDENICDEAGS